MSGPLVYHGAQFDQAVAPTKPIVGVVRDKDTGKPIAGVTVQSHVLAGGPRDVRDLGGLANGFVGNAGLWVDLVRVPPPASGQGRTGARRRSACLTARGLGRW